MNGNKFWDPQPYIMQIKRALETLSPKQGASNKSLPLGLMEPSGIGGRKSFKSRGDGGHYDPRPSKHSRPDAQMNLKRQRQLLLLSPLYHFSIFSWMLNGCSYVHLCSDLSFVPIVCISVLWHNHVILILALMLTSWDLEWQSPCLAHDCSGSHSVCKTFPWVS